MTRFILITIFLLISLLAVFRAPVYYLWLLAVGVTEYPLIFAGITSALLLWGFQVTKFQLAGTVLGLVALVLYLSPIARAYWVGKDMQQEMVNSLGNMMGHGQPVIIASEKPFSIGNLFSSNKTVAYKTITYVKYKDTSVDMDLYPAQLLAKYTSPRPCVIVVHGGSWSSGDSKQLPELNSYLATRGYYVAAINYRMAPKYQSPAPVEDIEACIKYLSTHAAELHIDTNKFILLGRSAGAQIALLAAYTLHHPGIKGVIDFYGPADMVWGYSAPANPLIMDSRKVMSNYIGGTYKQVPQKYFDCSPIEFIGKRSVPTLIIHGDNDVLVSPIHSRKLSDKLTRNGIGYYLLKLPWATHGFDFNLNGPGGQLSTYAVETFVNTITQ